jgi:hypothetical protein
MGPSAFDAHEGSVTVCFGMSIVLASHTLDDVFVFSWWFNHYNTVQHLANVIDIFIVIGRLQVYEEQIKWFLCLSVLGIDNVSDFVAVAGQFFCDVFGVY